MRIGKPDQGGCLMLKKSFAAVLTWMLVLSFAGGVAASSVDRQNFIDEEPILVALGDSITSGYGLFRTLNNPIKPNLLNQRLVSKEAYPQLVGDAMGFSVKNLAVSGWTSEDLLFNLLSNNRYRNTVAQADVILLNIGGNDVLGYLVEVDFSEFDLFDLLDEINTRLLIYYNNLGFILQQIRLLNPTAPILQYGFYNPLYPEHTISYLMDPLAFGELYVTLNELIPAINYAVFNLPLAVIVDLPVPSPVCGFLGYVDCFGNMHYVDAWQAFELYGVSLPKAGLFVDEVHPSRIGHQVLAQATLNAILH